MHPKNEDYNTFRAYFMPSDSPIPVPVAHVSFEQITAKEKPVPPVLKEIRRNNDATVVYWEDGTYTTVLCSAEDANNVYAAYCAAYQKKLLGSTSAVHKLVDRHLHENIKAKQDAEKARRVYEQKQREKRNYDRAVRAMAKQMQMEYEANLLFESER